MMLERWQCLDMPLRHFLRGSIGPVSTRSVEMGAS
jgi:hypothetical protein